MRPAAFAISTTCWNASSTVRTISTTTISFHQAHRPFKSTEETRSAAVPTNRRDGSWSHAAENSPASGSPSETGMPSSSKNNAAGDNAETGGSGRFSILRTSLAINTQDQEWSSFSYVFFALRQAEPPNGLIFSICARLANPPISARPNPMRATAPPKIVGGINLNAQNINANPTTTSANLTQSGKFPSSMILIFRTLASIGRDAI
ncbi:hypothetical protein BamIOP4010DRAFT_6646 [Burkholderia ambifaria IOP40-10]|uniref:Uncharacterized protein n=1 Tax=Burkholderia ambifaria IOP40-10 TaxID=396596 RepID=B1FRI5_9BURK|nr:hypothetical protein BamIOP4010DRAFT_6646 [Burkholderia ambifaria IOP40-10]